MLLLQMSHVYVWWVDPEFFTTLPVNNYQISISQKLKAQPEDEVTVDSVWSSTKASVLEAAEEVIGRTNKKHQDWFDENDAAISELIK